MNKLKILSPRACRGVWKILKKTRCRNKCGMTVIIISSLFLSACSSVLSPVTQPEIKTYVFNPSPVIASSRSERSNPGVLYVSMPTAPAWLNTSQMAYQVTPNQIAYFTTHAWAAPPVQLLQPWLVEAMQNTHRYRAVLTTPVGSNANQELDVHLLKMQQIFLGSESDYLIKAQVTLINLPSQKIVFSKTIEVTEKASAANPVAGVLAADKAVGVLLGKIIR